MYFARCVAYLRSYLTEMMPWKKPMAVGTHTQARVICCFSGPCPSAVQLQVLVALVRSSPLWCPVLEHGATHVSIPHAVNSTGFMMWLNTSLRAPCVIKPMHQDPQRKEQEQTHRTQPTLGARQVSSGTESSHALSAPPPGRLSTSKNNAP